MDQQHLQRVLKVARSQVSLILDLLGMLLEEIVLNRQDLQVFLQQTEQGQAETQLLSATVSSVRKTHEYLKDLDSRPTCYLSPLKLDTKLIPYTGPQPPAMISYKVPVVFDRLKTHVRSSSVYLVWGSASGVTEDPNQLYEVQSMILHPTVGEQDMYDKRVIHGLSCTLENLTPDRFYQFSVKRLHSTNLVYKEFMDTIILKTQ